MSQADLIVLSRGKKPNILNSCVSTRSFQRFQRAKAPVVVDVLTERLGEKEGVGVGSTSPPSVIFWNPPPGAVSRVRSFKIMAAAAL